MYSVNWFHVIFLTKKIFRQIDSLVISLLKTLLSRNSAENAWDQIAANSTLWHYTVWKNEKFTLTEKKFREINSLVICLVKPLISRIFSHKCVRVNFPLCGNYWNSLLCRQIFFHQIKLELSSLVKTLISRNFCGSKVSIHIVFP